MTRFDRMNAVMELATGRLDRLLVKYSWPALVAVTLNALYSVVDRLYIGQGCGEAAMAALTLATPVVMLFGAFGVFIGAGHAAILSIRLGEGDRKGCERALGELVALKILFFAILPPLVYFNLDTVLGWCGGQSVAPEALALARQYLAIVIFPHIFSHLAFGLSAAMRAEGGAIPSMMCMVVGFGANLALDPILIFGFGMGVAGAAWATNAAMALSCAYALAHYWRGKSVVRLRLGRIRLYRDMFFKAAGIGFAPFLQQLLGSLINVSLAAAFAKWAADEASATQQIASLGVFQVALILVFMPIMGAQQGLQPIFGYNWGAKNYRRVLDAFKLGFWTITGLCVLAFVVQVIPPFPRLLARLFVSADNPALITLAAHDLAVSNCMFWCIGLNVLATVYYQSIGRPTVAVILSTLRQGVVLLPIVWLLPRVMTDHALAVWLSLPVSDVACFLITIPPIVRHVRFLRRSAKSSPRPSGN